MTPVSKDGQRFRFRFFIHQILQQGKWLENGKHTNISKQQHWYTSTNVVESHYNVSFIVRGKVTKAVSANHNFWRERRADTEWNRGPSADVPASLTPWGRYTYVTQHFDFQLSWGGFTFAAKIKLGPTQCSSTLYEGLGIQSILCMFPLPD